jgi:hypothetical protein
VDAASWKDVYRPLIVQQSTSTGYDSFFKLSNTDLSHAKPYSYLEPGNTTWQQPSPLKSEMNLRSEYSEFYFGENKK